MSTEQNKLAPRRWPKTSTKEAAAVRADGTRWRAGASEAGLLSGVPPGYEEVAQARASGMSWKDAAKAAGIPYHGSLPAQPWLVARVRELQAPALKKTLITIEELAEAFVAQGTFDPAIFAGVNSLADLEAKVDEPSRRLLVKGWKYNRGQFQLILVDKDTALDRLARWLGMYNDKVVVQSTGFDELMKLAAQRAGMKGKT